ncbi:hypothetical protein [Salinispora arenicola]|nr:hypothetical protein [Salinispora arenicola]
MSGSVTVIGAKVRDQDALTDESPHSGPIVSAGAGTGKRRRDLVYE